MTRLSVAVDSSLLETAVKVSGASTKREAIELALRTLIQAHRRAQTIRHAGAFPLTLDRATLRQLRRRG